MVKVSYACLALALLLGTQFATSKSIVEPTSKLIKRQAEADTTEEATTTLAELTTESSTGPEETTTTLKPSRRNAEEENSTEPIVEEADPVVEELPSTTSASPPRNGKPKKQKKPLLVTHVSPDGVTPATSLQPPPNNNIDINNIPLLTSNFVPPQNPFAPWSFMPQSPTPPESGDPYFYPKPSGPAFSDTRLSGGRRPTGVSGGVGNREYDDDGDYDYNPGYSRGGGGGDGYSRGGGAGNGYSRGGGGGSGGGNGYSGGGNGYSGGPGFGDGYGRGSGPGDGYGRGGGSGGGDYGRGGGPGGSGYRGGGDDRDFSSASASASSGPNGGTVSTSSNGPGSQSTAFSGGYPVGGQRPGGLGGFPMQPAFLPSRGGFPDDPQSIGIDVNGPGGIPAYVSNNPISIAGPGYSASAGGGAFPAGPLEAGGPVGPMGPGFPGQGIPQYGGFGGPMDLQSIFQQYFAALQAQQQAFQQQIQAQIDAQRQAGGTFASGGAVITNDQGQIDPNATVQVNTFSSPNSASVSTSVDSRSGFGGSKSSVSVSSNTFSNANNSNNSIWDQSNRVDGGFGYPGSPYGPASASASANIGPNGGFQSGNISPVGPGILSRFGESIPPPSGGNYGVFSSSSSSSSTGPDGKTVNHKSATVGVNDNGKVRYKTVHDP